MEARRATYSHIPPSTLGNKSLGPKLIRICVSMSFHVVGGMGERAKRGDVNQTQRADRNVCSRVTGLSVLRRRPEGSTARPKTPDDAMEERFYLEPLCPAFRPYSAHAPRFELFAGPDQALLLAERATPL